MQKFPISSESFCINYYGGKTLKVGKHKLILWVALTLVVLLSHIPEVQGASPFDVLSDAKPDQYDKGMMKEMREKSKSDSKPTPAPAEEENKPPPKKSSKDRDRSYERSRSYDRDRSYERGRYYDRDRSYERSRNYDKDRNYRDGSSERDRRYDRDRSRYDKYRSHERDRNNDDRDRSKPCWDPKPDILVYSWDDCYDDIVGCKRFCTQQLKTSKGKCIDGRCTCVMPWVRRY